MLPTTIDAPNLQTSPQAPTLGLGVLGNTGKAARTGRRRRPHWLYAGLALTGLAVAATFAIDAPIVFSMGPALLAFGCTFGTRLIFGYMPAHKAATLDPVVALGAE